MSNTVSYVKLLVSAEKIPTMAEGRIGKYTDRKMCDDRSRALQMGPCCIWSESPNDQKLIELSCKSTDISVASVFMLSCPIVLWRNYFVLFNHSLTTWKGFWWLFAHLFQCFKKGFQKSAKWHRKLKPSSLQIIGKCSLVQQKKKIRTNELQYKNVTNHLTALLLFQCIVELTVQILTDTISDHDAGTASECHL